MTFPSLLLTVVESLPTPDIVAALPPLFSHLILLQADLKFASFLMTILGVDLLLLATVCSINIDILSCVDNGFTLAPVCLPPVPLLGALVRDPRPVVPLPELVVVWPDIVDLVTVPPYSADWCWDGYCFDGGTCDAEGGGGRDSTVPVAVLIISELGSQGSLEASAEGIAVVDFLLLVVVVVVTVDNKVEGSAEVLKGKLLSSLALESRVPMVTRHTLSLPMYSDMHTHTYAHTNTCIMHTYIPIQTPAQQTHSMLK